jgi:PAS domain S-box-containing protein
MPGLLWLAAREHHDALVRELALFAQEHPDGAPTPDRLRLADQARAWISSSLVAAVERHRRTAATAASYPTSWPPDVPRQFDLELHVPAGAASAFTAMQDVLDAAERLAVAGRLLARPGLPEIVAVRDWACEQGIAQLSGVQPAPWPGTDQERFTTEIRDREQPQHLLWDATVVTEATTGAVAADDANRIIAVSRPLATALGWPVEELVGRRITTLVPPDLREAHVAGFTRHLTNGSRHILGVPLQLPVMHADGTSLVCDVLIDRSPAAVGRPVYIAWIDPVDPATDVG